MIASLGVALASCGGDGDSATLTATAPPSATPEIARTPAPIASPPQSFTPRSSPTLPVFDGVILVEQGGEQRDYLQTDDGEQYGIEGVTEAVEEQLRAQQQAISRVRLTGSLLQPVPDVGNRQIRVSLVEPLSP